MQIGHETLVFTFSIQQINDVDVIVSSQTIFYAGLELR